MKLRQVECVSCGSREWPETGCMTRHGFVCSDCIEEAVDAMLLRFAAPAREAAA